MKKKYFIIFVAIIFFLFFSEYLFSYSYLNDDYYNNLELIDIIEKYKIYYIGDVVEIIFVFNKKPLKIVSENKDVFIRNYIFLYKENKYFCKVYFQFFNLGNIELKNVKFIFPFEEYELSGNKINISYLSETRKINFYEMDEFFTLKKVLLNLFIYFFIIIIFFYLIYKIFYKIDDLIKKKNIYLLYKKELNYLKNLKTLLKKETNIKSIVFDLSDYIYKKSVELTNEEKEKINLLKYKYEENELKEHILFLDYILNKIINNLKNKQKL